MPRLLPGGRSPPGRLISSTAGRSLVSDLYVLSSIKHTAGESCERNRLREDPVLVWVLQLRLHKENVVQSLNRPQKVGRPPTEQRRLLF